MQNDDDLDSKIENRIGTGYALGYQGLPITEEAKQDPCCVRGYLEGISSHVTELYIANDIEGVRILDEQFEQARNFETKVKQIQKELDAKGLTFENALKERAAEIAAEKSPNESIAAIQKSPARRRLKM